MKNKHSFFSFKLTLAILLALLIFYSALQTANSTTNSAFVYSVKVKNLSDKIRVYVKADGKFDYKIVNMDDPYKCLILEISPAQLDKYAKITKEVNTGAIKKVRVGQFSSSPDVVRVVVELNENSKYEVYTSTDKKKLSLTLDTNYVNEISKKIVKTKVKKIETPVAKIEPKKTKENLAKTNIESKKEPKGESPVEANQDNILIAKQVKIVKTKPVVKKKDYVVPKAPKKKAVKSKEKLLTVNYENVEIDYVLEDLAKKSGDNIVADGSVQGTITAKLTKVTLERALQVILSASGFEFKKISNIYLVGKPENLAKATPSSLMRSGKEVIEVIPLVYNKAKDFASYISKSAPDAVISSDERLNAIVVRGPEELVKYIKDLTSQLDQLPAETPVSALKTEVVRLNYSQAKDIKSLVETWFPGMNLLVDERLNAFILKGEGETLTKIKEFIAKVDKPKRQVELDVKVVNLTESGSKSLGVQFNRNSTLFSTTLSEVRPNGTAWQSGAAYTLPTYMDLPFQTFARGAISIPVTVNYLVTKGEAKVIASPKVVTLSGQKASLNIGENYPITYSDPRAGSVQATFIDIAVRLEVTATITPDGYIVAEITPDVSEMATTSLGSAFPETTKRKLTTNIVVKDGQTIVLGGLYNKEYRSTKYNIPFLGDIPVIGEMFGNKTESSNKDELVVMITPKIINE